MLSHPWRCIRALQLPSPTKNKAQLHVFYFYFLEQNICHLVAAPLLHPTPGPHALSAFHNCCPYQTHSQRSAKARTEKILGTGSTACLPVCPWSRWWWHWEETSQPAGEGILGSLEPGCGHPGQGLGQVGGVSRKPKEYALPTSIPAP